jgi:hypothetical protein
VVLATLEEGASSTLWFTVITVTALVKISLVVVTVVVILVMLETL